MGKGKSPTLDVIAKNCDLVLLDNSVMSGYKSPSRGLSAKKEEFRAINSIYSAIKRNPNVKMPRVILDREFLSEKISRDSNMWNIRLRMAKYMRENGHVYMDDIENASYGFLGDFENSASYGRLSREDRHLFKSSFWAAKNRNRVVAVTNDSSIIDSWKLGMRNGDFERAGIKEYFKICNRGGLRSYKMG